MNLTDLFVVTVFVSGVYGLIVALSGRRHFLTSGVNPYRGAWILAGISSISFGRGLLWWEAHQQNTTTLDLLKLLITEEATPVRVKIASVSIVLGLVFLLLVVWCWKNLPRDPSVFRLPEDRQRALDYYVIKLKGGLDYAVLISDDGASLLEAVDAKQIAKRLEFLPRIRANESEPAQPRTAAQQIEFWRSAARGLHEHMEQLDEIVAPAHQGRNRRILFDTQFGAFYFIYLRVPDRRDDHTDCLYLFGATLNQEEVNHKVSDHHFDLLVDAMRNIYRNIGMEI